LSRNWKSRTEFEKAVQHSEKSDGNWKFQPEILRVRPHFGFPDDLFQSCPEFEKVSRLSKKSGNFGKSQTEILISRRKSKFPGDFRNFRPAFSISVRLFKKTDNFSCFRTTLWKSVRKSQKSAYFSQSRLTFAESVLRRTIKSVFRSVPSEIKATSVGILCRRHYWFPLRRYLPSFPSLRGERERKARHAWPSHPPGTIKTLEPGIRRSVTRSMLSCSEPMRKLETFRVATTPPVSRPGDGVSRSGGRVS